MDKNFEGAKLIEPVTSGVNRWIGGKGESNAYVIGEPVKSNRVVVVDPWEGMESQAIGLVSAVIWSGFGRKYSTSMQSASQCSLAWNVPFFFPNGAGDDDEKERLSFEYSSGESLPGGLVTFPAPGPSSFAHALWLTSGPRGVVFLGNLLWHDGSGILRFAEDRYLEDPWRTRLSVYRISERLPVEVICFQQGPPILEKGASALHQALMQDSLGSHLATDSMHI